MRRHYHPVRRSHLARISTLCRTCIHVLWRMVELLTQCSAPANDINDIVFLKFWGNSTLRWVSVPLLVWASNGLPQNLFSLPFIVPMPNPFHVPRTMITLYFHPTEVSLNPRDSLSVTTTALEKMFQVSLQAAKERIPEPKVPERGLTVLWRSVTIGIWPNPAAPENLQAVFARQALEGIILYCAEEGWGTRVIEVHHQVLGYVANILFTEHIGNT